LREKNIGPAITEMGLNEQIAGWAYLPVHAVGMHLFATLVMQLTGFDDMQYNLFCYNCGFFQLIFAGGCRNTNQLRNFLLEFIKFQWTIIISRRNAKTIFNQCGFSG